MIRIACLACIATFLPSAQAAPGIEARTLYSQDFEAVALGTPPYPVQDNSSWAGSTVPMSVVDTGDPRYGKALECQVSGYCQIVLGDLAIEQGCLYRVRLDISSRGAQTVNPQLRLGPGPYTVFVSSIEQTSEEMRTVSFIGRAVASADPVLLMLLMNGHTTLLVDNLRVEEITGDLPPGDPPVPGNLVPNSGFELLRDGWFLRGDISFTDGNVCEGRHAIRLGEEAVLSSTWLPLSMQADYIVRARVRSLGERASVHVSMSNYQFPRGGSGKAEQFNVTREDGWKTVGFTWRPPAPDGKITRLAEYYFQAVCDGPAGAEVLLDAAEVKAVIGDTPDEPYSPISPLELAVTTDAPYNVATLGEDVIATVLATSPPSATRLDVRDERGRLFRSIPVAFVGLRASVALRGLPSGYWQLVTRPRQRGADRLEAESFLAVVPPMPDVPLPEWTCGTHISDSPALRKACWKLGLRWDRLHDTAVWTKWPLVEPERDRWTFDDDTAARYRADGHAILGLLDLLPDWTQEPPLTEEETQRRIFLRPETLPLWEDYCRRSAAHWRRVVNVWEVMNEPYGHVSPGPYVETLEAAYRGVKAGNPGATVIGLGGSGPSDPWLFECLKLGAGRHCDAISFHGYGATIWSTVTGPERLVTVVDRIRASLREAGTPDLPIWDTECGPSVEPNFTKFRLLGGESSPMEAARMFPKSVAAARAAGLAHVLYYSGHEKTHAGDEGAGMFLADLNLTVRKGVVPLAVANSLLEGRRFVRQIPHPESEGLVDLTFSGRGETVRMLWCMGDPATIEVGRADRCLSIWGRSIAPTSGRLELTQDPVYVISRS